MNEKIVEMVKLAIENGAIIRKNKGKSQKKQSFWTKNLSNRTFYACNLLIIIGNS